MVNQMVDKMVDQLGKWEMNLVDWKVVRWVLKWAVGRVGMKGG